MKTLYFDCFAGASGNMILGALVALGVDENDLVEQIKLLDVADFSIEFTTKYKSGIAAIHAEVKVPHEHKHRHLHHIEKIINDSRLDEKIKKRAIEIFTNLAKAEAKIHGVDIQKIHFHEVGAMDAIVDVVGACVGFELLGIERFACSKIHVGSGFAQMAHGKFPIPPPAVAELLQNAPIYSTEIEGELITPTGAAIITTVCGEFGKIPEMRVEKTAYGAGTREYKDFPNALRLILGTTDTEKSDSKVQIHLTDEEKQPSDTKKQSSDAQKQALDGKKQASDGEKQPSDGEKQAQDAEKQSSGEEKQASDTKTHESDEEKQLSDVKTQTSAGAKTSKTRTLTLIETNLDDISAEILGYVMERAFDSGALDCWFTPIQMKKNRPATMISILCDEAKKESLIELLYTETSTLGVRVREIERHCLPRETVRVESDFGAVDVKIAKFKDKIVNIKPEYEQIREIALKSKQSLREVEREVLEKLKKGKDIG